MLAKIMGEVPCQVLFECTGVPQRDPGGVKVEGWVEDHPRLQFLDDCPRLLRRGQIAHVADVKPSRAPAEAIVQFPTSVAARLNLQAETFQVPVVGYDPPFLGLR
ncbi:MAG: hypothetical protein IH820_14875, partial [Bacteroidetes bacterium]|nr:hypothetical protein [Bacteroidota bacterium]